MVNMQAFRSLLLLLAPGVVNGAVVVNGTNTCLDSEHDDYSCRLPPGSLTIDFSKCGLVDSELATLDECIESEGVKDLPIKFIMLGGNEITEISEEFLAPYASTLGHLHLEENELRMLPPNIFADMTLLQKLFLQDNSLTSLPSTLFDGLSSLENVDLSSNPGLQCVPSTEGTKVQPGLLILPDDFAPEQCDCLTGGCEDECAPGDAGYVCSGGPTPSPASSDSDSVDTEPPSSLSATPVPTPDPVTASPDGTPAPATTPAPTTPAPATTPAPTTPAPTVADNGGVGDDSSASDDSSGSDEESTCFNGIPGLQVGDACCDPGCTKCGGVNCSQEAVSIGLTEQHCCVDTIISAGLVCGEDVMAAPCISYATPAPTPPPSLSCSVQETEDACKGDSDCRQCMYVTTIEQEDEWKQCFEGYNVDVNDPCSPSTAMTCCLVASGENCMENEKFVEYSLCFIKESSGGAECPDSLTCDDSGTQLASTQEDNAAGRLASPLNRAGSFVVGMTLALVGAALVVQ